MLKVQTYPWLCRGVLIVSSDRHVVVLPRWVLNIHQILAYIPQGLSFSCNKLLLSYSPACVVRSQLRQWAMIFLLSTVMSVVLPQYFVTTCSHRQSFHLDWFLSCRLIRCIDWIIIRSRCFVLATVVYDEVGFVFWLLEHWLVKRKIQFRRWFNMLENY